MASEQNPTRPKKARAPAARLPGFLPFQHPRLVERPPAGAGWVHEVKLDGYRMQLRIERGRATWFTRTGLDWTERLPDLADEAAGLPDAILDGELCALDEHGHANFSLLRSAMGRRQAGRLEGDLVYYVFDVLHAGREDLRGRPLAERRARLADVLGGPRARIALVEPVDAPAAELLAAACAMGLEGLVSKRLDAPYEGGEHRPLSWLKVKCRPAQEVVIGGWRSDGERFGSLLSGVWEDGRLRYTGRIPTGYSAQVVAGLLPRLKALETPASPYQLGEPPRKTSNIHWVRPELVARVEFASWSSAGKLRQASFKGLREDKPAEEVVAEVAETPPEGARGGSPHPPPSAGTSPKGGRDRMAEAAVSVFPPSGGSTPRMRGEGGARARRSEAAELHGVPITNPDKPLWPARGGEPAVTKLDLARYYAAAAGWLLSYLRGRPCTLVVAPDGIGGEVTWVRHEGHWRGPLRDSPLVRHMTVEAKAKTYPVFDTVQSLVLAADQAVLEFHPWNSVPDDPMTPGRLVFDLDPEEGQPFEAVARAAEELESRLLHLGLLAFLKTSGRRGLHVVVPLDQSRRVASWEEARTFAMNLCRDMAADSPDRYTTALPKAQRRGRLFLDYLRNDPGHHAVGLLSARTTPEASVSMPISWKALRAPLDARAFTVRTALGALKREDPWRAYEASARPLR